jgi:hypothetical protein
MKQKWEMKKPPSVYADINPNDCDLMVTMVKSKWIQKDRWIEAKRGILKNEKSLPIDNLKAMVHGTFAKIEKKMIGSRYRKKQKDERITFYGFAEGFGLGELHHYHLLVKIPDNAKERHLNWQYVFSNHLQLFWKKFSPPRLEENGEINPYFKVEQIRDKGAVYYCVKEAHLSPNSEHIIVK